MDIPALPTVNFKKWSDNIMSPSGTGEITLQSYEAEAVKKRKRAQRMVLKKLIGGVSHPVKNSS
jgi:hypothetical protein